MVVVHWSTTCHTEELNYSKIEYAYYAKLNMYIVFILNFKQGIDWLIHD